jgi:tetratricopeptide (TPR) repeat protein
LRRFALPILLICLQLPVALTAQPVVGAPARDKLRQQAMQLQAAGEYRTALELMRQVVAQDPQPGNLMTMLDLQVQLRLDEEARQTMERLERSVPGWPDDFSGFQSLNTVGHLAAARYRMGETDLAETLWKRMENRAADEMEAGIVFHSFQEQRLFDQALEYAERQRDRRGKPALWAMELAQLHESQQRFPAAFDEYCLLLDGDPNRDASIGNRLLRLAEKAGPGGDTGLQDAPASGGDLVDRMVERALKEAGRERPRLARLVFEVCIQQKAYAQARSLAQRLDPSGSEGLLAVLAHAAVSDGSFAMGLEIQDEIRTRHRNRPLEPDQRLDRGRALEGLGRFEPALQEYDTLALDPGPLAVEAQLSAARLLHETRGDVAGASQRLERLLAKRPRELRAVIYQVRLLGALGEFDAAETLRVRGLELARSQPELMAELEFLGIQHAWWRGQLSQARERLKSFLEQESQHPIFNDAIDLIDLLAYSGSDSLIVVQAAVADRQAWSAQVPQAIATLKEAATKGSEGAREWLDWQVCVLAAVALPVEVALEEQEHYRTRHTDSIRLDRLHWMRYQVLVRAHAPASERQAVLEELLERWPDSILQDPVRREIRQLEALL